MNSDIDLMWEQLRSERKILKEAYLKRSKEMVKNIEMEIEKFPIPEELDNILNEIPYIHSHIECKDGFSFSLQCSDRHVCSPKKSLEDPEQYTHYELKCEYDSLVIGYNNGVICERVPKETVLDLIRKHGGFEKLIPVFVFYMEDSYK